jgi:Fe-S-cluster-containing hydrogenase component 2
MENAYVITAPCIGVKDGSCADVCPVDAIHTMPGADQYFIDPEVCTWCGACQPACPVEAIFIAGEVPEKWQSFIELNASLSRAQTELHRAADEGG